MKFYKRDPDAAIAGMAELTLEERGAYNTIIDQAYSRDGILRDDDRMLARMLGCHILKWRRIRIRLMTLGKIWVIDGRTLGVTRVDTTLEEARQFSKAQANRAHIRWENHKRINGTYDAKAAMPSTATATAIKKERKEAPRVARGPHLIPAEWKPNEKHSLLASQLGLSTEQMENYSCQMRDWSKGAGKKRTDWDATFNNWMRREAQRAYKPNGKHEPPREYKPYRPPGWTEEDDRKLREHYADRPKNSEGSAAETKSLLDASAGVRDKNRH